MSASDGSAEGEGEGESGASDGEEVGVENSERVCTMEAWPGVTTCQWDMWLHA